MKLSRYSFGIFFLSIILSFIAVIFDEPGLIFISCSLSLFLLWRYILFIYRVKKCSSSCVINRTIDGDVIKQGVPIKVLVEISIEKMSDISLLYQEKLPHGCNIQGKINHFILSDNHENIRNFSYWLTPQFHGSIRFAGGNLIFSDTLFYLKIPLTSQVYTNPVLKVIPASIVDTNPILNKLHKSERYDDRRRDNFIELSNIEYPEANRFRKVDWKLTEKNYNFFTRDYTWKPEKKLLIIVEISENEDDEKQKTYDAFIGYITKGIKYELENLFSISILVISGPNVIDILIEETNWTKIEDAIHRNIQPDQILHHQYRLKQRVKIQKELLNNLEIRKNIPDKQERIFFQKKIQVLKMILQDTGKNQFSEEISQILDCIHPEDIVLYSLCNGDLSHIQEIIFQSHIRNMKFYLKTSLKDNIHLSELAGLIDERYSIEAME